MTKPKFTSHLISSYDQITFEQFKWRETKVFSVALGIFSAFSFTFMQALTLQDQHKLILQAKLHKAILFLHEWTSYINDISSIPSLSWMHCFNN